MSELMNTKEGLEELPCEVLLPDAVGKNVEDFVTSKNKDLFDVLGLSS